MRRSKITIAVVLVLVILVGLLVGCTATGTVKSKLKDMAKGKNYTMTIESSMVTGDPYRYVFASQGNLTYSDNGIITRYYDKRYSTEIMDYYERKNGIWYLKEVAWADDTDKNVSRPHLKTKTYKALVIALENLEENFEIVSIENSNNVEKTHKVWSLKKTSETKVFASGDINRVCRITAKGSEIIITITHGSNNSETAVINKIGTTALRLPKVDVDTN